MTVGENDVPAMISTILKTTKDERGDGTCSKVQVLTNAYAIAEVLAGMAAFPITSKDRISNVMSLAPCAVSETTFPLPLDSRRLLEAVEDLILDIPRELHDITETEFIGRKLQRNPSEYYWNVTLRNYCDRNPDVCYNYCDFYPEYCEEFCDRFP